MHIHKVYTHTYTRTHTQIYTYTHIHTYTTGTGKSALLNRFINDSFEADTQSTIGVDFQVKVLNIDGKKVKLSVWDTGMYKCMYVCMYIYAFIKPRRNF